MQKVQIKPYLDQDAAERLRQMAEHYGMSSPALAALVLTEMSRIRKEALFEALGVLPPELKTRPVGRPAGSTKARSEEKNLAHAHAAA